MSTSSAHPDPPSLHAMVLGGYGLFGQHISARLAADPRMRVSIAGRHPAKSEALIATLSPSERARCTAVHIDTEAANFEQRLASLAPDLVIDTAGPFQSRALRVPRAAIAIGAHCVDLADGRDYVQRIATLDADARAAGCRVVSGASSVPGLSAAVVAAMAPQFEHIESIEAGISPGNHTPRGLATTRAILGYVGKPYLRLSGGRLTRVHGWQSLRKVHFEGVGKRWFARCEVPDLDVLPAVYPTLDACDFRAGLELHRMHFGLWLASWAVRAKLVRSMADLAMPLLRLSERWQTAGTDVGVMYLDLSGRDPQGNALTLRWELIARGGDGPHIPATPAVVLAQKLAGGTLAGRGASACTGLFTLEDVLASLAPYAIESRLRRL